ncbi:thiolase family protein [Burkholderia vietnamiensis]|uniref:thiolase family protein n=1 Tax=Burkholderia vietnamiensis TaxID=60552 RepID=UPI001CF26C3D|nr:thiolase family protein [Burkholderia vietnamiensis]MCA8180164.1 thiolase family protein [Burkholderia vietnamiensis]
MVARQVVICSPVRTPIGAFGGTLKDVTATALGAAALREAVRRSEIDPAELASVVMGNVVQAGNKMNPARQAAVAGGIPVTVPALTVNRVCGSGAQAIANAAQDIWLGFGEVAAAGGMENMDGAPYLLGGGRWGYRMGNAEIADSMLVDGLVDAFSNLHSGWHTEDLVAMKGITREQQDRWAERSQRRFADARARGAFDAELVAVEVAGRKQTVRFERDEQPRPDTNFESLARLKPAFRADGTITAGNAPGLNSGAAAMIVAERRYAETRGIEPIATLVSYGVGAVEPGLFGLGPVPAVKMALARAGWSMNDVERFEINEAFAAVPIAVARELGIDEERINVEGGAIAHGHAIGATGAVLTTRLAHSMRRDGIKRGIVTLCIGGGQGIALALEAV